MSKMFLDPHKPIHTCTAENCDGCGVSEELVCHFNIGQLLIFLSMAFPVFLLAGFLIYQFNPYLLIPWILFILFYFGLIEIRVLCSHCPHYAEPTLKSLQCWANYGSPKFWKYRPYPMSSLERVVFYLGFIVILSGPVIPALLQKSYVLLGLYVVMIAVWKWALKVLYCSHCMNLACPFNTIDGELRKRFFDRNPAIGKAWEEYGQGHMTDRST